jgi:Protein of unknown function (DUF2281)
MGTDTIEKIKTLPLEKQQEVDDFVDFLVNKYQSNPNEESIGELRRKNAGWAKGKIWMADDFNETPEDFKDYM